MRLVREDGNFRLVLRLNRFFDGIDPFCNLFWLTRENRSRWSLKKIEERRSTGAISFFDIKRGETVKNISKIRFFRSNRSFFVIERSIQSWKESNRSRQSLKKIERSKEQKIKRSKDQKIKRSKDQKIKRSKDRMIEFPPLDKIGQKRSIRYYWTDTIGHKYCKAKIGKRLAR